MYDVYLLVINMLFTYFLMTQILIVNKFVSFGLKGFLESMNNYLKIPILPWNFPERDGKIWFSAELSLTCPKNFVERYITYRKIPE